MKLACVLMPTIRWIWAVIFTQHQCWAWFLTAQHIHQRFIFVQTAVVLLFKFACFSANLKLFILEELECDFSRRALNCFWAPLNVGEDDANQKTPKWEIGVGTVNEHKFQYLTRRNSFPGLFLMGCLIFKKHFAIWFRNC